MDTVEAFLARGGEIKRVSPGVTAAVLDPIPLTKNGHRNPMSRRSAPPAPKRMSSADATAAAVASRQAKYRASAAKVKAAYERGEEILDIADMMACSEKTVRNMLRAFNVSLRKAAPRPRRNIEADILAAYHDGLTAQETAEKLTTHAQTVRKVLYRHGLRAKRHTKTYSADDLRAIAKRHARGHSIKERCHAMDCPRRPGGDFRDRVCRAERAGPSRRGVVRSESF